MSPAEEMNPGPELDALIAERVMGWTARWPADQHAENEPRWNTPEGHNHLLEFSKDHGDAWEVVEKLRDDYHFNVDKVESANGGFEAWKVSFVQGLFSKSKSFPHAICLAALKAVGY